MSELAKSHIEIIDESSYGAGPSAIIPLYVFATEQDKVVDAETGEIAPGTLKSVANEVILLTSRKDVTDTYGIPSFTVNNGTVMQGDELNEVGLYGLYDGLGNAAYAYGIRADIDLKQLKPTSVEPYGEVDTNTLWLDLAETNFGLFRSNGNERVALSWDKINNVLIPSPSDFDDEGKLLSTFGSDSDIAMVKQGTEIRFYENIAQEWFEIGSEEWKEIHKSEYDKEVSLTYAPHTTIPTAGAGSIWVKTTQPNNGSKYVMKRYNKTSKSWLSTVLPLYNSYVQAESELATSLKANTMIVHYENGVEKIMSYGTQGLKITGSVKNPTVANGDSFIIETVINNVVKHYEIVVEGTEAKDVVKAINKKRITTIVADLTEDNEVRMVSSTGNTIRILNGEGTLLENIGIVEGEHSKWEEVVDYTASVSELTSEPEEGTLWFNDTLDFDIMVNDGEKWVGYRNLYDCAEIFKTSEEPMEKSDGSSLTNDDLWVDTANPNYPTIYRYYANEWELVDTTDQTTPLGIIFADARENAGYEFNFSTKAEDLMVSDYVDPNTPNPLTYPKGILLFNTLFSTNNVKVFENTYENAVKELGTTYKVGESQEFKTPGTSENPKTTRWSCASGNQENGAGYFGRKAQRRMIVRALAEAIKSNEDIRTYEYDFFFATCPGYPELDDELVSLNADKKDMFMIVSDTPARLAPKANDIVAWGSNKNNAVSHGEDGRIIRSAYMTRTYPPMGLTSNVDGNEVAIPSSIAKMKNLLLLPRGMTAAGTQYGQVKNLASVGYIDAENEYAPITVRNGLGEVITGQSLNPIMPQRNTGLLFWGENTENSYTSSLSDEHAILTVLRLKRELEEACLPFFFRPNTESLRKDFHAVLSTILNSYVGTEEIYDYVLVTDRTVNTEERIERKELWAEIGIEITKFVEMIYIPIRIVRTGALSSAN